MIANRVIRDTSATSVQPVIVSFLIACPVRAIPAGSSHLTTAKGTASARRTWPASCATSANRDTLR